MKNVKDKKPRNGKMNSHPLTFHYALLARYGLSIETLRAVELSGFKHNELNLISKSLVIMLKHTHIYTQRSTVL